MYLLVLICDDKCETFAVSTLDTGTRFHPKKGRCKAYVSAGLHLALMVCVHLIRFAHLLWDKMNLAQEVLMLFQSL